MTDKTIKELAEELRVPKSKVNYQVSKLNTDWITVLNGIKYLNSDAQKHIKASLGVKLNAELNNNLNDFEQQLEPLKKQLDVKDKQIESLQKLLDQQQQLTLQSNKRIEQLETQLQLEMKREKDEEGEISLGKETQGYSPPTPEKKWWHFLR